jgi:hypothetical protein
LKSLQWRFLPLALSSAVLVACGGGGGTVAGSATASGTSLGGTVIDGTIEGATVFMDLNNNQTQDSGEPSAITNSQGGYTLDTTGLSNAQIRAAHLVTVVPTTAKDSDDGGQTLAQAGKRTFTLMAPAQAFVDANGAVQPALITPVTTLVSHGLLSDSSATLTSITSVVQTRLGLDGNVSLTQDVRNNAALHAKAQMIAATIGDVQHVVQSANVSGATARDTLFASLTYLQQNLPALQAAVNRSMAANSGQTPLGAVRSLTSSLTNTASTTAALVPNATNLVQAAQAVTTSAPASMTDMFTQGSYSGECLLGAAQTGNCSVPKYNKLAGTTSSWAQTYFQLASNAWTPYSRQDNFTLSTSGAGWVVGNAIGDSGTVTVLGNSMALTNGTGWTANATTRAVDVGGKRFDAVSGITFTGGMGANVFPSGAKVYFTTISSSTDTYEVYGQFQPGQHTSLSSLIDAYATPQTGVGPIVGDEGMQTSFNESGATAMAAGAGSVTVWNCSGGATLNGCQGGTWSRAGTASYVIRTVNGRQILIIEAPYMRYNKSTRVIFSVNNANGGIVNGGAFVAAGAWAGAMAGFNRTAFDAILAAGNKPATVN